MQNLAVIREWLESHQSDSACHVLTFLKTRIGTKFRHLAEAAAFGA